MVWLATNWIEILAILGLVGAAFVAIAKLTPTPKDDEYANMFVRFVNALRGFVPQRPSKGPMRD